MSVCLSVHICDILLILHLSPLYDVPDHANHIFSESLSSGDDNDRDEYLKKDKYKYKDTDKDKYNVLQRANVCYIFEDQ